MAAQTLARHRRQREECESKDREADGQEGSGGKDGRKEGGREGREDQVMAVRLGVSCHREERERGEDGRTGSISVIDIPPAWSE